MMQKRKGGHAVTSGLEPWHIDPKHSCLGPRVLVYVPVCTYMLWSFICRSLSITAMFPEPDHLQQLKMPLQLAHSVGLWSTLLTHVRKRSCFAKKDLFHSPRACSFSPLPTCTKWSNTVSVRIKRSKHDIWCNPANLISFIWEKKGIENSCKRKNIQWRILEERTNDAEIKYKALKINLHYKNK